MSKTPFILKPNRAPKAKIVAVFVLALYLIGAFWGAASAVVSCKVTVVFTESGRTIITVTPRSGQPVRFEWVDGSAVPQKGDNKLAAGAPNDYRWSLQAQRAGDELSSKPSFRRRAVLGARTILVLSKTGFRIFKTTLTSVVTALLQR
jgi:hypothetical protein